MSKRKDKSPGQSLRNQIKNLLRQNKPLDDDDIAFLSSTLGVTFGGSDAQLGDSICREIFSSSHAGSKNRLLSFGDILIGQGIQANPDEPWATFTAHFAAQIPDGAVLLRLNALSELEQLIQTRSGYVVKILPEIVWNALYAAAPLSASRLVAHSLAKAKAFGLTPIGSEKLDAALQNSIRSDGSNKVHPRIFGLDICVQVTDESFDPDVVAAQIASALESQPLIHAFYSTSQATLPLDLTYYSIGAPCSSTRDYAHSAEALAFKTALAQVCQRMDYDRSKFSADIMSAGVSADGRSASFVAIIKDEKGEVLESVLCGPTSDAGLLLQELAEAASIALEDLESIEDPASPA